MMTPTLMLSVVAALLPLSSALLGSLRSVKVPFEYTHLEVNAMIWRQNGVCVVVDPIAGQLDFGIPQFYRANQQVIDAESCLDLVEANRPDAVLLSQGLDDHTHIPTLKKLLERMPELKIICAPSAAKRIRGFVPPKQLVVLRPGQSMALKAGSCSKLTIRATEGALVGPPWQARENGFLVSTEQGPTVYYEPHGDVDPDELRRSGARADIVISPVCEQRLPGFTLVHGAQRTLGIAKALGAQVVIPLRNGELTTTGPLAGLIEASGGTDDFEDLLKESGEQKNLRVVRSTPGETVKVSIKRAQEA